MNHLKALGNILITSFILSIVGFIIDLGERIPDVWVNLVDITLMTGGFFGIITTIYLLNKHFYLLTKKRKINE